ncbi:thiamine phosphate synthase [Methylocystis sp. WRRC1]|uniref:thiamine phosphate synthase n=1 Tax=Methylocystis sp. WRRC1 TaxID=1732014 RepID=UPI001D13E729|nr:thiamine phosphate synthase [Methylocystis sp. WRRC1]MCC3245642.1 thiamine phosphate synthase [Methylocystis sp. WRRC1]
MSEDAPRLYLATPPLAEARDFLPALTSALSAGEVASLLIRLAGDDPRRNEDIVRALAPLAQEKGVAVLVDGSVTVALRARADGAHVSGSGDELADAVKKLSPRYIVGAGGLALRDDAMRAGELGADYVLFEGDDREALADRVSWWAELFNTPCVARAASLADVAPLAQAGADFVMLDDAVWTDSRSPAAAVADALNHLQEAQP